MHCCHPWLLRGTHLRQAPGPALSPRWLPSSLSLAQSSWPGVPGCPGPLVSSWPLAPVGTVHSCCPSALPGLALWNQSAYQARPALNCYVAPFCLSPTPHFALDFSSAAHFPPVNSYPSLSTYLRYLPYVWSQGMLCSQGPQSFLDHMTGTCHSYMTLGCEETRCNVQVCHPSPWEDEGLWVRDQPGL